MQRDGGAAGLARAAAVHRLYAFQRRELEALKLYQPLLTIEMPLVWVLSKMERIGICLNSRLYNESKQPLQRKLIEVILYSSFAKILKGHKACQPSCRKQ